MIAARRGLCSSTGIYLVNETMYSSGTISVVEGPLLAVFVALNVPPHVSDEANVHPDTVATTNKLKSAML